MFITFLLVLSCDTKDKVEIIDITQSGKWYTTSITTTNYDSNNKIVETCEPTDPQEIISQHSLEFLTTSKFRLSALAPTVYFD